MLCLTLLGSKAPNSLFAQRYCSQRFHYCLDYPASLFPNPFFSADEDSLIFKTPDQLGEVSVIGTVTDKKQDSHLAFEQRMRVLSASVTGQQVNILSIINGDDYYEVNFLYGSHWYHQKAGFYQNYDVLFTIRVPVNRPELMVRLKEDVSILFD